MSHSDDETTTLERELTVIEGGKSWKEKQETTISNKAALAAEGLLITTSHKNPSGIGLAWPQVLGVIPYDTYTLVIVSSFCLVTLHGPGVATLARPILDRKISEMREGGTIGEARVEKITIESKLLTEIDKNR